MGRIERLSDDVTLYQGDCREILPTLGKFDAVVTDPPYELGFMGKSWDASGVAFCPETWRAVFNVMKPGAHLVAFGAPKNYHRLACAIEDAGFEIRDSLMWVFGSGFPKSMNIGKALDKLAGESGTYGDKRHAAPSSVKSEWGRPWMSDQAAIDNYGREYIPASDEAKEWAGWGTALKPAYEPIVLARKPLSEKTVAANVLRWGTGALNIDATRVGDTVETWPKSRARPAVGEPNALYTHKLAGNYKTQTVSTGNAPPGRWPANLCHDGSQGVLELFPHTKSGNLDQASVKAPDKIYGGGFGNGKTNPRFFAANEGSAARFFYCAKASKQDRAGSKHPTVKPINLMRWLIRMVTPPNGLILDPFAGSGTTAQAAVEEGFAITIIEKEADYFADICSRMNELKKTKYEVSA